MEISSLTDHDFIRLVATYADLNSGDKQKVSSQAVNRGYTPEQLAQAKSHIAVKFNPVTSCGLRFTRPYSSLKFEPFSYVLTLYENYERGCLPFPGSVSEQPAQIMEVFSVLRQLKHEAEVQIRETQSKHGRNQYKNKPRTRR
jgi:hypothetical protein